mgnify:FL=1
MYKRVTMLSPPFIITIPRFHFFLIAIGECGENSCGEHGQCENMLGAGFECICEDGWSGEDCSEDINDCENEPCANGGHCKDKVNGFSCDCNEGWMGDTCTEYASASMSGFALPSGVVAQRGI